MFSVLFQQLISLLFRKVFLLVMNKYENIDLQFVIRSLNKINYFLYDYKIKIYKIVFF